MQNTRFANSTRPKKPMTVKIAVWSSKHRWLVFGLWFLLIASMVVGSQLIPDPSKISDPNAGLDFESAKAISIFTTAGGVAKPVEDFYLLVNHPSLKVTDPAFQSTVAQLTKDLNAATYSNNGQKKPIFSLVVNPYEAPTEAGLISADKSTVRIYAQTPGESLTQAMMDKFADFPEKVKDFQKRYPDFKIKAYGSTLIGVEAINAVQDSLNHSLLITLIPTFLILLFVFGAFVAAIIPLVLALSAIIGTVGVITAYSKLSGTSDVTNALTLAVLMGLAVAVDYSLFFISRYRSERNAGRDKLTAIEVASGTAGRAVFFSGMLVAISVAGLFLLGGPIFSMALGTITVVLLSVLGSITFLPALLAILGKGINWGRIPFLGRGSSKEGGLWGYLVRGVMRYPVIVTVITTTIMLSLAFPLLHIQLGINNVRPANLEGTQARNLLEQKWPQGSQLKLQVVITQYDQPQTQAKAETFKNTLLAVPGLSGPVETSISQDGKVGLLSFIQSGTLNDQANWNTVDRIRKAIVPQYFNKAGGPQAYVSGLSAVVVDQNKFFINPTVWIFVLALSFLVLLVVFRSLVIAVKAILLNLLTTGAAYGAVILVFQDGLLWVKPTGLLESWLPVLIFTIIFGLSMDYHLFILTRIKELRDQGYNTNKAVALGISSTSGTITGAAAIMVVVFGDFFVGVDLVSIQQLGLGLAVAVFLDATIVRSMLLPAVMGLMGEANWWLPKFLNWLPNITIESEPEAVETTPEPAVALLDRV